MAELEEIIQANDLLLKNKDSLKDPLAGVRAFNFTKAEIMVRLFRPKLSNVYSRGSRKSLTRRPSARRTSTMQFYSSPPSRNLSS
jgi:hypothetical protein